MFYIGCHLSASGGFLKMGKTALELGANTFQFFTRNPRGGSAKPMDPEDAASLMALCKAHNFGPLLAHAPYTLNACSKDEKIRDFAYRTFVDDLERLEYLPGSLYNFHPGSHVGQGMEVGIAQITDILNRVLSPSQKTTVLLETMAGKGSEVGSRFEEIRAIIDGVKVSEKIGVCLDTCHVHDAGYDIVNNLDGVLDEFDRIIGLDRLCAVHLNDSMNPFESHKDRHQKIGEGALGLDAVREIINNPRLRHLPFYLETPNDEAGYGREIELLRSIYKESL
ncbi:MAG: deoxyribonuclease IV [Clostridia bacterium]|nr:deoxyribonuclease IV [Clostridia bacterium]